MLGDVHMADGRELFQSSGLNVSRLSAGWHRLVVRSIVGHQRYSIDGILYGKTKKIAEPVGVSTIGNQPEGGAVWPIFAGLRLFTDSAKVQTADAKTKSTAPHSSPSLQAGNLIRNAPYWSCVTNYFAFVSVCSDVLQKHQHRQEQARNVSRQLHQRSKMC